MEAVTRLTDVQATLRRIELKRTDAGNPRTVLLLADTRATALALRVGGLVIGAMFPIAKRRALQSLGAGRDPGADALVVL